MLPIAGCTKTIHSHPSISCVFYVKVTRRLDTFGGQVESNGGRTSGQIAIRELRTISEKESSVIRDKDPRKQMTSPYAVRIMVRLLKTVYTGIERYWMALLEV